MANMDAQSFDNLANVFGTHAAGEVLLLAVARVCGDNVNLWNNARSVGIPWRRKNWSALTKLQKQYNDGVDTALPALPEHEKTSGWEDNAEEGETMAGGEGASAAAPPTPTGPPYSYPPALEYDRERTYTPRSGQGTIAAPACPNPDVGEHDDALSTSSYQRRSSPSHRSLSPKNPTDASPGSGAPSVRSA